MSYYINPILSYYEDQVFPLDGPPGYDVVASHFYPEWSGALGDAEWAEFHWFTPKAFGIDFENFTQRIAQSFSDLRQGGHPIAWRLYHNELWDEVDVPDQICSPDWIPWIGSECIQLPDFIAGKTLVPGVNRWVLQLIYQGSPAAIALTGSLTLILLIAGIFAIIVLTSTGTIHLDPGIKQAIEANTPSGLAGSITTPLLIGIGILAIAMIVSGQGSPLFSTTVRSPEIRAGPLSSGGLSTTIGNRPPQRAPAATPRRQTR